MFNLKDNFVFDMILMIKIGNKFDTIIVSRFLDIR